LGFESVALDQRIYRANTSANSAAPALPERLLTNKLREWSVAKLETQAARRAAKKEEPAPQQTVERSIAKERFSDLQALGVELLRTQLSLRESSESVATANEELQSTNEELMSTNEELQSTNEQLQSVNEKLNLLNTQIIEKNAETQALNLDLYNLMQASQIAMLFLDAELRLRRFSPGAASILALTDSDLNRTLPQYAATSLCLDDIVVKTRESRASSTPMKALERRVEFSGHHYVVRAQAYMAPGEPLAAGSEQGRFFPDHGYAIALIDWSELHLAYKRIDRLALVAERPGAAVLITDRHGLVEWANSGFERITGFSLQEAVGQKPGALLQGPETDPATIERMRDALGRKQAFDVEILNYSKDKRSYWLQLKVDPVFGEDGELTHFIAVQTDVTERKRLEQKAQHLAHHDALTELLNRRGLEARLTVELVRARRSGLTLSAIMLDGDNFKQINDRFGYNAGDMALAHAAKCLTTQMRATDLLARVGGDEFLVILPDTDAKLALVIAERLRFQINTQPVMLVPEAVVFSVSVAVGPIDLCSSSLTEVMAQLESQLKIAKSTGKNRTVSLDGLSSDELDASDSLRQQLAGQDFIHVLQQPIVDLTTNKITGYELLSRGPVGALQFPNELFRAATEQNLLVALDLRCLRACAAVAADMPMTLDCHLNILPSTLLDVPTSELVSLLTNGMQAKICVELNEQQILGNVLALSDAVTALKRAGIRVALDDVGFGRTWLEAIIELEPDVIKIDRRCINGISESAALKRSLSRLLNLASALNALVIAEGLEYEADRKVVQALGVRQAQGYLLGRPESAVNRPITEATLDGR
jgi:diguanylate cyclase (GGDEF)-like protein/PAS domain S-box-containing protein